MSSPAQTVNVSELNLQQLDRVKSQLEDEVQMLSNSMKQLKIVQARFAESKESLSQMTAENSGKPILVPLTCSMYIPGKLTNSEKVLVDIGTGYFVEKEREEAEKFFQRKVDYVTENLEKMQKVLMEKHKIKGNIIGIMQQKFTALQSQQQKAN